MNNVVLTGLGILVLLAVIVLVFVIRKLGNRKLSASAAARIRSMLEKADQAQDLTLRVIEYDKVLDQLLFGLGFQGSTGDKLMKAGPRLKNKDALWRGHKLRNVAAHEHGATLNESDVRAFRSAIEQAITHVSR